MLREEEAAQLERQQVLLTQIVWLCLRPDMAAGKQCRLLLPRPLTAGHHTPSMSGKYASPFCVCKEDEAGGGEMKKRRHGSHGKS